MNVSHLSAQDFIGEYSLTGVHEMACGLKLNPDSTFNFYYIYGAAERYAEGKWNFTNGKIILNTAKKAQPDFILLKSKHIAEKKFTIKVTEQNKQVLPFVVAYVKGKGVLNTQRANSEGEIEFADTDVDTIYLQHGIWENAPVVIPVTDKKLNYFEFKINPEIVNIEIQNVQLVPEDKDLKGGHPLMDGEFLYIKQE